MTTTTSTTSSTSTSATVAVPAAKKTTSTVNSSAANAILTSLGTGSGVDTSTLVTSLVDAEFATKTAALQNKYDDFGTQISSAATLKSTITSFATALKSLVSGGTLQTQPNSSNGAAIGVSNVPGEVITNLSSTITVSQLADRQSAVSATSFASSAAVVGTGTLTLTLGSASFNPDGTMATFTAGSGNALTVDITDGKLSSIVAAINAKNAGVTASLVTDADGTAYVSLKGATGAKQAFTLSSQTDAGSGDLSVLNVGVGAGGTRFTSTAQDAKLTVDGVPVTRSSNAISDLVGGVRLQLNQVTTAPVSLSGTRQTSALSSAVTDLVDTYNQVLGIIAEQTNSVSGVLKNDPAAKALLASLQKITTASLITGNAGDPTTLAQIGVRTNRDGTLAVDSATLTATLAKRPGAVEGMFTAATGSKSGLSALLTTLSDAAASSTTGLGASTVRYTKAQSDVSREQTSLATKRESQATLLTQRFSAMNSKVAAYKSIQSYLTNQIAAWNKSGN